jgi:GTP-binding protein Era
MNNDNFKSGYTGLIGRTNVGKSTLINTILNKDVVITSGKAQTTRSRINCIYNTESAQTVFVDCPGFFKPKNLLGKRLNSIIYSVLDDIDIISVMVDIASGIGRGDEYVFEQIRDYGKPKILVLNKIDLLGKNKDVFLKKRIQDIRHNYPFFKDIIAVSALNGKSVKKFLNSVMLELPKGPRYYPEGMVTDLPLNKIISEVVRSKLADNLYEELPHSISVELADKRNGKTKAGEALTRIECVIYVEKKSQKAIIIGKSGRLLKKVGEQSRIEIEDMLDTKVFLQLWVKIMDNWTKNEIYLNRLGY